MKNSDKIKRAIAFYISVILFLVTLPILLSYSLGYRIDYKNLKVYKTGILFINSKPSGAYVYINDALYANQTPVQLEKMKPGSYKIKVKRDGFYPWEEDLVVRPNMVTKADSIILFPIIQDMSRISRRTILDFIVSERGSIYYMTDSGFYKSNMDGSDMTRLSTYTNWPRGKVKKLFSPDGDKILCFNDRDIIVIYLDNHDETLQKTDDDAKVESILSTEESIIDVFWYTGSGYIIVVTEKYINVLELRGGGKRNIATLYKFNASPTSIFYDPNGSLYFMDREKNEFSKNNLYLYRLDLRKKFFDNLMQVILKREAEPYGEKRFNP